MKKLLLGFLSLILAGTVSFAQPVSDMAVIPMGITIQSVMRLAITKGGNIEFVFKSATDVSNGLPSGGAYSTEYETTGIINASQNWDLDMTVDESSFIADNGGANLDLGVVSFDVTTSASNTDVLSDTQLAQNLTPLENDGNGNNLGNNITFAIQWACGVSGLASASVAGSEAGRYSANVILTLVPH